MITVRLVGGLGNQMYQYAAARALAVHHDTSVYLDTSQLNHRVATERTYGLGCFELRPDVEVGDRDGRLRSKLSHPVGGWRRRSRLQVREGQLSRPADLLALPDRTYLVGYFQSYRFFSQIRTSLQADFEIRVELSSQASQLLDQISSTESVSVHVRRGDYVTNERVREVHEVLDRSYYERALQAINPGPSTRLFVFSDDPSWCREHLDLGMPSTFVEQAREPHEDLGLMSRCSAHIIANSSFSWWAAWLAEPFDKIVVAPQRWFTAADPHEGERIPSTWIRV